MRDLLWQVDRMTKIAVVFDHMMSVSLGPTLNIGAGEEDVTLRLLPQPPPLPVSVTIRFYDSLQ